MPDALRIRPITASVKDQDIRELVEDFGEIVSIQFDRKKKFVDVTFSSDEVIDTAIKAIAGKKFKRKVLHALYIEDERKKQRRKLTERLQAVFSGEKQWAFEAKIGLGPLKFGASREDIFALLQRDYAAKLSEFNRHEPPPFFATYFGFIDEDKPKYQLFWAELEEHDEAAEQHEDICSSVLTTHDFSRAFNHCGLALIFDNQDKLMGLLPHFAPFEITFNGERLLGTGLGSYLRDKDLSNYVNRDQCDLFDPQTGLGVYFRAVYGMYSQEYYLTHAYFYAPELSRAYVDETRGTYNFRWLLPYEGETVEFLERLESLPLLAKFQDGDGKTLLHYLSDNGSYEDAQAEHLLRLGADPEIQDRQGNTPLHFCREAGMVKILLQHGADPTIQNNDGQPAFHCAVSAGYLDIVQAFVESGRIDINSLNAAGQTPWEIRRRSSPQLEEYLLSHGAKGANDETPEFEIRKPDLDWFWTLIPAGEMRSTEDNLDDLRGRLEALKVDELYKYQEHLGHIIDCTQNHPHANHMARIFGVGGDDSFYDLMLWFIAKGRVFWEAMQNDPEQLADYDLTWEFESQELEELCEEICDERGIDLHDYEQQTNYRYSFPKIAELELKLPGKAAMKKKYPRLCRVAKLK